MVAHNSTFCLAWLLLLPSVVYGIAIIDAPLAPPQPTSTIVKNEKLPNRLPPSITPPPGLAGSKFQLADFGLPSDYCGYYGRCTENKCRSISTEKNAERYLVLTDNSFVFDLPTGFGVMYQRQHTSRVLQRPAVGLRLDLPHPLHPILVHVVDGYDTQLLWTDKMLVRDELP